MMCINVAVMGEPIQEGSGQSRISKDFLPTSEIEIAGDDQTSGLVTFGHELEEEWYPRSQFQIAKFIQDDQFELAPALQISIESEFLLCLEQFLSQCQCPDKSDAIVRLNGCLSQSDGNMCLARATWPQAQDVLFVPNVVALRQPKHLLLGKLRYQGEVKGIECLELWELGVLGACLSLTLLSGNGFVLQTTHQKAEGRDAMLLGIPYECLVILSDAWQTELLAVADQHGFQCRLRLTGLGGAHRRCGSV